MKSNCKFSLKTMKPNPTKLKLKTIISLGVNELIEIVMKFIIHFFQNSISPKFNFFRIKFFPKFNFFRIIFFYLVKLFKQKSTFNLLDTSDSCP